LISINEAYTFKEEFDTTQRARYVRLSLFSKEELKNIDNMQLTSDNILEKLLHPAANLDKRQSLEIRKYDPKFEKRDY